MAVERLREHVEAKLLMRLFPEQIGKPLIKESPRWHAMHVTPETICEFLYLHGRG